METPGLLDDPLWRMMTAGQGGASLAAWAIDTRTLPTAADIAAAQERLRGVAVRTPLINAPVLDERLGARVSSRRRRCNAPARSSSAAPTTRSRDSAGQRAAGVVAYSCGNHAQGVAASAKLLGLSATIVMPSDAPRAKRARTEALGAEVVAYDRDTEDRVAIAARIVAERGATLVPPYDDPLIIAGQGTIGARSSRISPRSASRPRSWWSALPAAGWRPASRSASRRGYRRRRCIPSSRRASTIHCARSPAGSASITSA